MRSSTSSSNEARFLLAFGATVVVLFAIWEVVLRAYAGASLEFAIQRPAMKVAAAKGETWVMFGNCLVMTGISPKQLDAQLPPRARTIVNIAAHEQSPLAYFEYLKRAKQYPDVIVANVSSWIRSTNFEQEAARVAQEDPLGIAPAQLAGASRAQAYKHGGDLGYGGFQKRVEDALAQAVSDRVWSVGHRYHLFDYSIFLWTLASTRELESSLYQLNIQSWFAVASSDTDGQGWVGIHVRYRDDWPHGVDEMSERYLKRMRLSKLLTDRYWQLLEDDIREFQAHGTRVLLVRMPEHPRIREFNDDRYEVPRRLGELHDRTGAPVLDISRLGLADGVRLFDSVHPDADAAAVITQKLATWVRTLDLSPRPR
jgi:hypothetical protein